MEETSRALETEMRKENKVIKMGYLVKSPSKNRDKAKYALYWKLRWCVLLQEVSEEFMHSAQVSKFVLYYYEDEESYQLNEEPKGHLDLSRSNQIKSCFKACAGFDHLFEIGCSNGKLIKFSASSCTAKFLWFDVLFKYIHNTPIQQLKSSKVISQSRAKSEAFDKPIQAVVGSASFQKPRSISLNQPSSEIPYLVWEDSTNNHDELSRTDSGISFSTMSSISSDDEPPQLPPPRRGSHQGILPSLLEDQNLTQCHSSGDFEKNVHKNPHLPPDESVPLGRLMSSKKQRARRAASLKELKTQSSFDEYFYCEKCQKGKSLGSKGIKRRASHNEKLIKNAEKYVGEDKSYDSTDAYVEARIYEEIDDKWLEMVRNMIAASETKEASTETARETKCDVISFSQTDSLEHFRESKTVCFSTSNGVHEASDKESKFEGDATSKDVSNQPDSSNLGEECEEIYVLMNLYGDKCGDDMEFGREALDSTEHENGIYESMEEIGRTLRDLEFTGTKNDAQSALNCTETGLSHIVASQEPEEITDIVKGITVDNKVMKNVVDKIDSEHTLADLVQQNKQSIGCFGRLELSGFSEQYNTKL